MTAPAIETAADGDALGAAVFTIAADGSYGARLAGEGDARFPERWTLDGPEPYAVPLPADQPEEPDTGLLPLTDGRVLIHRRHGGASHFFGGGGGRHSFSLLYPTGPRTGELPVARSSAIGSRCCRRPRTAVARTPWPWAESPPPYGWWRAAPSGPSASPRSRGAARGAYGSTVRGGCSPWTGRPTG